MKILILASNPRNDLDLNQEIRDLKDVIDTSRNRQEFEVEDALAVRVGDLQELLLKHQPQIVHFCGHGGGQPGLVFEGKNGGEQWVRTEALRDLFRLFSSKVGCVLLNACYSEEQANEIVNHIDYVIGMNQEIRDDAAIAFAKGFYRALGYNCSIEEAYEFGCNAIQLEISGSAVNRDSSTAVERKLNAANMVTSEVIPEHLKPTLKKNSQANSSGRWREGATKPPPLSQTQRAELQQEVVRAVTGFGPNPGASAQPWPLFISTPAAPSVSPAAPPLPTPMGRRLGPLFLGGLVACLIPTIGFYGYQQWQKRLPATVSSPQLNVTPTNVTPTNVIPNTVKDTRLDLESDNNLKQAIEFAQESPPNWKSAIGRLKKIPTDSPVSKTSDFQFYLKTCSENLFKKAEKFYKNSIDEALLAAKDIPENAPNYQEVQANIASWNKEKQTFEALIQRLDAEWDLIGARRLLKEIQNPDLQKKAEDKIGEIDKKYQQKIFNDLIKVLDTQKNIAEARKLLEKITNPDLRAQAEAHIKEIDDKIKTETPKNPEPLIKLNPDSTHIPQVEIRQKSKP